MRSYLVCITNNNHRLLNSIHGVTYDQIGFIAGDTIYLYWTLPTKIGPYIGPLVNLQLVGMKLYRSKLKEKWNIKTYKSYFRALDKTIADVNVVFKGLHNALTNYQTPREVTISNLDTIFYNPELILNDPRILEPKCKDLMLKICSQNLSDLSYNQKLLDTVKEDIERNIISTKTLASLEVSINGAKDSIIVIERDQSIREAILLLKKRIELALTSRTINLYEAIEITNSVLGVYGEEQIALKESNLTLDLICYDDKLSIGNKVIPTSLVTKELMDKNLGKDELLQMLTFLNEEMPTAICEQFKTLITELLYKKLSSAV